MRAARDERGAALVFVALMMSLLIVVGALAVDLGMQRVLRRDMQALADAVALDLAHELDGRKKSQLEDDVEAATVASVQRNAKGLDDSPQVEAEVGIASDSGFVAIGGEEVPNAVRVVAEGDVGFAFAPGDGGATRSAVATSEPRACFQIGSYAARLRTGDSAILDPLLSLLGSEVTLSVADLEGLAAARVDLLHLLDAEVGAATFEEVLGADISLADYYLVIADALQRGSGRTAQVDLLERLAVGVSDLSLDLGDVLGVALGDDVAGLAARLNVLDLVTAGAFAANGSSAVTVPDLSVNVGEVVDLTAAVSVLQQPQIACGLEGEAQATSSQTVVTLTGSAVELHLPGLNVEVALEGEVRLATATGTLDSVDCHAERMVVDTTGGLLTVDLTLDTEITVLAGLLRLGGPITVTGSSPAPEAVTVDYAGGFDTPAGFGERGSGLPHLNVDVSELRPLGQVLDAVLVPLLAQVVNPLLESLDRSLLSPLFEGLGLDLSGAEVYALPTPDCTSPVLRG